ncbi:heavy-metal-associated domain-containing protein [Olivibacter sitiensis]|uniref:heavy-metal-associated domain-containing protein n=1 Tax=Olivibacter sitiensis TaxID=376470 RepID=UPI0004230D88|nr:heavy-metal-associated domain-containing protein [Olivibacter sitiensis]
MKSPLLKSVLIAALVFAGSNLLAQEKTSTFKVYGNCGMCKKRIEKTANVEGVSKAEWNKDTKILTLVYDEKKTDAKTVQQKIAAVGHDTELAVAPDSTYSKLPGCCLYERKSK